MPVYTTVGGRAVYLNEYYLSSEKKKEGIPSIFTKGWRLEYLLTIVAQKGLQVCSCGWPVSSFDIFQPKGILSVTGPLLAIKMVWYH